MLSTTSEFLTNTLSNTYIMHLLSQPVFTLIVIIGFVHIGVMIFLMNKNDGAPKKDGPRSPDKGEAPDLPVLLF